MPNKIQPKNQTSIQVKDEVKFSDIFKSKEGTIGVLSVLLGLFNLISTINNSWLYKLIDFLGNTLMLKDVLLLLWEIIRSPFISIFFVLIGFAFLYQSFRKFRKQQMTRGNSLIEREQAQDISNHVVIENVVFSSKDFIGQPYQHITFAFTVFNKSLFDVAFEDSISGQILFDDKPIRGDIYFSEPPKPISTLNRGIIRVEQRLSNIDVEAFERRIQYLENLRKTNRSRGIPVGSKLTFRIVFIVKASDDFAQVPSQELPTNKSLDVTKENFEP